jgi:hypothetical protein
MKNIIFLLLVVNILSAQKEDNIYLFGAGFGTNNYEGTWGVSYIDFNYNPPEIYFVDEVQLNFHGTNACISDEDGHLLMYTNGMSIAAGDHHFIADTIAYGSEWEINKDFKDTLIYHDGMIQIQGAMILPDPADSLRYFVLYSQYQREEDYTKSHIKGLYYSHVDMRLNEGKGGLVSRDVPMVEDSLGWGGLSACRHANGRDWWVMQIGRNINEYHQFLISENEIYYEKKIINIGIRHSLGQLYFSPDGSLFAIHSDMDSFDNITELRVFDFDRNDGSIYELFADSLVLTFSPGLSFSADSKKLYISTRTALYPDGDNIIYQYDLEANDIKASKSLVAVYDGYEYIYPEDVNDPPFPWPVNFGYMGLAPDGKIYICPTSGSNRRMSTIDYPHEEGEACTVSQHSIKIPTSFTRTMPNFPNYRLGPLDGSPADTLGLNNHPIAKYRYEQDTLDHLTVRFTDLSYFRPETWYWTFGDGNTTTEQYPYHSYDKNGLYEVCLTVSNENSSNTSCRTLTIGTSAAADITDQIELSIYPNPFVDQVLVTLGEYIPQDGYFVVYDISGKEVHEARIYYGWNSVNLSHLTSGTYVYELRDGEVVLKSGKLLK